MNFKPMQMLDAKDDDMDKETLRRILAYPELAKFFDAPEKTTTETLSIQCRMCKEEIARAISDEIGKPMWEARTEAGAMAAKVGHSIRAQASKNEVCEGNYGRNESQEQISHH